jgi:hypothetical protein
LSGGRTRERSSRGDLQKLKFQSFQTFQ